MVGMNRKLKPRANATRSLCLEFLKWGILLGAPLAVYKNWKYMSRLTQEQLPQMNVMSTIEGTSKPQKVHRKLEFSDLTIHEYLGKGAVNMACIVTAPDVVYHAFELPHRHPLVMKITINPSDGMREIVAFRRMNKNRTLAKELNILPLIYSNHNLTNPFYCPHYSDSKKDVEACPTLPNSFPERQKRKLWRTQQISVLVIPYTEKRKIHDEGMPKTIKFYKHVLKSLFGQLALAHRVGVSNFDLSDFNNILLDEKGDVVLIDWNGNMYVGEPLYDPDSAFSILPPEAWFETIPHNGKEHDVMISSTHALDVWEVGIVFAKMLFQPCQWANYHCFNKKYDELLDATIYATARGNNSTTMLYVNEEAGEVDLRTLVKKNKNYTLDSVTKTRSLPDFTPLLCNGRHKCDAASFPVFDKLTAVEQHQALDLLRNMMRLSPKDRPTFDVLLKHPFFNAS